MNHPSQGLMTLKVLLVSIFYKDTYFSREKSKCETCGELQLKLLKIWTRRGKSKMDIYDKGTRLGVLVHKLSCVWFVFYMMICIFFLTKTYMLFQFKQLEVIRSWHVYPSSLKVNINIKLGSLQTEKYVSL